MAIRNIPSYCEENMLKTRPGKPYIARLVSFLWGAKSPFMLLINFSIFVATLPMLLCWIRKIALLVLWFQFCAFCWLVQSSFWLVVHHRFWCWTPHFCFFFSSVLLLGFLTQLEHRWFRGCKNLQFWWFYKAYLDPRSVCCWSISMFDVYKPTGVMGNPHYSSHCPQK